MYPACITHVSRMSPSYQIHLSLDAFEIHVSHHVSWMYPACILITLADTCISHVSRMYPASQIRTSQDTYDNMRYMYLACILEVSRMYSSCILEPMQIHLSLINLACIMHVSCMYPQAYLVCIQRGSDEASKIHVS